MRIANILALAATSVVAMGMTSVATAKDSGVDHRVYIAPLASYSFGDETDDTLGFTGNVGINVTNWLALEVFASLFEDADLDDVPGSPTANVDESTYGLSALLFPARDVFPVYGLVGYGFGEHDFDNLNNIPFSSLDEQDSESLDLGAGVLIPLTNLGLSGPLEWVNKHGLALRAEYRYRQTEIDGPSGAGDIDFDDHIISVGLQIPLGTSAANRGQPAVAPRPAPAPAPTAPADSDGDGVPDNRDQCPGTVPGTRVDANGCPITKAVPVVLKGVTFEFDSARLTARAEDRLKNVVNALQGNKSVNVMIGGHTDSVGSDSYNLDLSNRRAASVKTYLSGHGVDPARLRSKGFGETQPVAPNTKPNGEDNPGGRAQNRRVELDVVK